MTKRILHIDDEESIPLLTGMLVKQKLGAEIVYDTNSRAEDILLLNADGTMPGETNSQPYDLIISDHSTNSRLKGLEAIAQARKRGLKVPIIVYASIMGDPAHIAQQIAERNAEYVPKPGVHELMDKINSIFSRGDSSYSPTA